MTRHVLLAWELGANRGHVTALGAVARALTAQGARITFAVQRLDAMRALRPLDDAWGIVQAPVWPGLLVTADFRAARAPTSFGDILADLGLRDSAVVEFLLRGWDSLLASERPDVVVTNFAPMAQLAAHGRVPVLAAGNGFTLPPDHLPEFPRLRNAAPLFPESQLLQAVNRGLARTGRASLPRLPALLAADQRLPHCFAIFDPYREARRESLLAPILPAWSAVRAGEGTEIFGYFSDIAPRTDGIFDALTRFGARVRLHIPNLPAAAAQSLTAAGVMVEPRPLSLAEIAQRSRLVVSHGGLGLVSMTLAAGLPQLVIAPDLEKRLIGSEILRLGVGAMLRGHDATADGIVAAIDAINADAGMAQRARALGNSLAPLLQRDSAQQIADVALAACA
jgi:UDP:flavonoid glycosyltransferase YjiC (YdhE family)